MKEANRRFAIVFAVVSLSVTWRFVLRTLVTNLSLELESLTLSRSGELSGVKLSSIFSVCRNTSMDRG